MQGAEAGLGPLFRLVWVAAHLLLQLVILLCRRNHALRQRNVCMTANISEWKEENLE